MPKLSGPFSIFQYLDKITAQSLQRWLPKSEKEVNLENFLANRLLYPQTIPVDAREMKIDLAILIESIRLNSNLFYNSILKQVTITEDLTLRFKSFENLIQSLIDGLSLVQTTKLIIKKFDGQILKGWIVIPLPLKDASIHKIHLIASKSVPIHRDLKTNTITFIPIDDNQSVQLKIDDNFHLNLDFHNLGILLDLRIRPNQ